MSETSNTPQPPTEPTPGASSTPPGSPPPPQGRMGDPADVEKNKVFALLSYLGILWLVPLLAAKDSPFAKYHCNQGILFFIGVIVLSIALGIGAFVVSFLPWVGWCASCTLWSAFMIAVLAYMILGILNAVNGKMKPLPGFPEITLIK